eukprot:197587_1
MSKSSAPKPKRVSISLSVIAGSYILYKLWKKWNNPEVNILQQTSKDIKLKLYNNQICPFGQRAWLVLEHKKIPYEFIKCDLKNKQSFFTEAYSKALGADANSDGKVPILYDDGKYITESAIIARYLDHAFSDEDKYGKPLLPNNKYERAAIELMIDWFSSSGWIKYHYGTLKQGNPKKMDEGVIEWKKIWKIFNEKLCQFNDNGLFLPNNYFSMFEILAFPFFERLITIQEHCGYEIYTKWMEEFPRVKSWYKACLNVDAIKKCLQQQEFLVNGYKGYRERGLAKYRTEQEEQKNLESS